MEYRSDVLVTQGCGRAGFAQEPLTGDLAIEVSIVNNLERDGAPKIGIKSLVSDAHCSPTQLPERAIFAPEYLIVLIVLGLGHGLVALTNQMRPKEANVMGALDPSNRRARLLENAKILVTPKFKSDGWRKPAPTGGRWESRDLVTRLLDGLIHHRVARSFHNRKFGDCTIRFNFQMNGHHERAVGWNLAMRLIPGPIEPGLDDFSVWPETRIALPRSGSGTISVRAVR